MTWRVNGVLRVRSGVVPSPGLPARLGLEGSGRPSRVGAKALAGEGIRTAGWSLGLLRRIGARSPRLAVAGHPGCVSNFSGKQARTGKRHRTSVTLFFCWGSACIQPAGIPLGRPGWIHLELCAVSRNWIPTEDTAAAAAWPGRQVFWLPTPWGRTMRPSTLVLPMTMPSLKSTPEIRPGVRLEGFLGPANPPSGVTELQSRPAAPRNPTAPHRLYRVSGIPAAPHGLGSVGRCLKWDSDKNRVRGKGSGAQQDVQSAVRHTAAGPIWTNVCTREQSVYWNTPRCLMTLPGPWSASRSRGGRE